jgi:hypothetical protein
MIIYVDKNKIEYNDKKAYPALSFLDQLPEYTVIYGTDPFNDPNFSISDVAVTNVRSTAEQMAKVYAGKRVYLIENPLNKGYKSEIDNLNVVWCWDDFQFFILLPRH